MALDPEQLGVVLRRLLAVREAEAGRLDLIYNYVHNRVNDIYVPRSATEEYRRLVDQSRFNILPLLVSSVANNLYIDGYRPKRTATNSPVWDRVWQPNGLDAKQGGIWRSALTYGCSYALVWPGAEGPVVTPYSPRRMTALYTDPINDEWPVYALAVGASTPTADGKGETIPVAVYDATYAYRMTVSSSSVAALETLKVDPERLEALPHNLGVTPVVRFRCNRGDLDDGPRGVVEPMLPAQRQLNQTTFSLLMAQQYAAFRQRWVTGFAVPEGPDGVPVEPWNAAVNRVFIAEDDTVKFGEFGETSLDGYLNSRDKTLLYVSAVRQIPPHTLVVGDTVSNISAEALAALEAGHQQDIAETRTSLGEDAEQMLRLGALAAGNREGWEDTSASVRWRDTTPRSLAQIADALGKLATLLGVPARALWEKIPDVTDDDLEQWDRLAKEEADEEQERALVGLMGDRGARANRPPADAPAPA